MLLLRAVTIFCLEPFFHKGFAAIKPLFAKGPSSERRLLLWGTLAIALMVADHKFNYLQSLRNVLLNLVTPAYRMAAVPSDMVAWFKINFSTQMQLRDENLRLSAENLQLRVRLQKLITLEDENLQWRELFKSLPNGRQRFQAAELLAVDLDPFSHRVVLNKGSHARVCVGLAVMDANGIVGQVIQTSYFQSQVLLVTDPSHAIPVQIQRNGVRAIAKGTGHKGRLLLANISHTTDFKLGDILVSSGLGGRFPKGYPVARVISIDKDPGQPFAVITAEPVAKIDRRHVLLISPLDECYAALVES